VAQPAATDGDLVFLTILHRDTRVFTLGYLFNFDISTYFYLFASDSDDQ